MTKNYNPFTNRILLLIHRTKVSACLQLYGDYGAVTSKRMAKGYEMIIDRIENWNRYNFGSGWASAFNFLKALSPDTDEQRYEILGDDVFALVMSYSTMTPDSAILEAHKTYVDIQTVLVGSEAIEWYNTEELVVQTPYTKSKDVELYERSKLGQARVDVLPGTFVTLFPQDAHMPALITGAKPELIKKVVIKVKVSLIERC